MGNGDTCKEHAIGVSISLSPGLIKPGLAGSIWVVVRLVAAEHPHLRMERMPVNLGLVLDRSGSMTGSPLRYVKEAARFVVDQMASTDRFSLVVFDDQVNVVCPSQHVLHKDHLKQAISRIHEGATTNLSGGLFRGYSEVQKGVSPGQVDRVLLLTDGLANVAITDPRVLAAKATAMAEKGISVSTIGLGHDFNENLLVQLAEAGKGNYYYLSGPDEIPQVLSGELQILLAVVAQATTLKMTSEAGLVTGILGYEPIFHTAGITIDLPDMHENEAKVLVFEVSHPPLQAGTHKLVTMTLDYLDTLNDLASVSQTVDIHMVSKEAPDEMYQADLEVSKVVELIRAAMAKDVAARALESGDYLGSQRVLEERYSALIGLSRALAEADKEVVEEVESLRSLLDRTSPRSDDSSPLSIDSGLLKEMKYQSYKRRRGRV